MSVGDPQEVDGASKRQAVTKNGIPDEQNIEQHHCDNLKFSMGKFTSKFKLR